MSTGPYNASALVREVVYAGDGVFLWITLVVNSLLNGLRKRDNIAMLRQRLLEMPKELDDLYCRSLSSIDRIYMVETSKMFQLQTARDKNEIVKSSIIEPFYAAYVLSFKSSD